MALALPLALFVAACPIQEIEDVDGGGEDAVVEFGFSEEDVLEARDKYRVSLVGLEVQKSGKVAAAAAQAIVGEAEEIASAQEVVEESGEEGYGEELEELDSTEGPRLTQVALDLIVRFTGPGKPLPGITVELSHTDPYGEEKQRHLLWAETPALRRGEKRTVSVKLEAENYEEGDEFSIEWSAFVPPEERGSYREFAAAGG